LSFTLKPGDSPSRIHAVEEQDRKILRQDLQDEQDELRRKELSPSDERLFLMPHPLFHPVNPVNPVKIQFFNCIVPSEAAPVLVLRRTQAP
jgi:hypothetical protein